MKKWYKVIFWRPDMGAKKIYTADGYIIIPNDNNHDYDEIIFYHCEIGKICSFKRINIRTILTVVEFE